MDISPWSMLQATYSHKVIIHAKLLIPKDFNAVSQMSNWQLFHHLNATQDLFLKEDHSLALNLSFSVSLGLLPVTLSLKTAGCGIKNSGLPDEEAGDVESNTLSLFL